MPLDDRSSRLRRLVLAPSGGWLGEAVIILSDLVGLWDIFVLMAIFVIFWVIMRTAPSEISLVLGLVFDLGIPLQYQNDDATKASHRRHLSGYWPLFVLGSAIELGGFLLFHPDLFTLIVCLKTTFCLAIWLTKTADGKRVDLNGSQRPPPSTRIPSAAPHRPSSTPTPAQSAASPPAAPLKAYDPRFPDAHAKLRAAGYDQEHIDGMIFSVLKNKDAAAKANMKRWETQKFPDSQAKAAHRAKYVAAARKARAEYAAQQATQQQRRQYENRVQSDKLHLSDKVSQRRQQEWYARLCRSEHGGVGVPRVIADVMMEELLQQPTPEKAEALYNTWKAVGEAPRGRERMGKIHALISKYSGERSAMWVTRRERNTKMPWDPPKGAF